MTVGKMAISQMLCTLICIMFLGVNSGFAKTKYTDDMSGFIGTWVAKDGLGNIDKYNIRVINGFVEVLERHHDVVNDFVRTDSRDCSFSDGKLIFDMDFQERGVYNHIVLYLENGNLIEYNRHRELNNNWVNKRVYQLEF